MLAASPASAHTAARRRYQKSSRSMAPPRLPPDDLIGDSTTAPQTDGMTSLLELPQVEPPPEPPLRPPRESRGSSTTRPRDGKSMSGKSRSGPCQPRRYAIHPRMNSANAR